MAFIYFETPIDSTNYTYGDSNWKDKLTSLGSQAITYDEIGNPLTYRGYNLTWQNGRQLASMQFTETRMYYLKSRYYDPAVRRFLNADGLISTSIEDVAKNMFAYCYNNPINLADSSGNDPVPTWALHIISGTATASEYQKALSVNPNAWAGSARCKVDYAIDLAKNRYKKTVNVIGRGKDGFTQRKDKKKGSENRGKSGARERNVGHMNGEEHSRVPKGNRAGVRRIEPYVALASISAVIVFTVANDVTVIGMVDDEMLPQYFEAWWDTAQQVVSLSN